MGTDLLVDSIHRLVIAPETEWFLVEPSGPFVRLNYLVESPARFLDVARILGEVLNAGV